MLRIDKFSKSKEDSFYSSLLWSLRYICAIIQCETVYFLSHIHMCKKQNILITLRSFSPSENSIPSIPVTVVQSNYSDSASVKDSHILWRTECGGLYECATPQISI